MSEAPYRKVHVVINPAAGKDEPILNVLNDVFHQHDVDWSVSITKKYGDATEFARQAAEGGADLVAGYGGDGTQHEIANGILGTGAVMGVLPGGTGNGFANEMGIPKQLRPAVELLCAGHRLRHVDAVSLGEGYFIQRLYIGVEPEEQTSREDKDRYGTFAYVIDLYRRGKAHGIRDVMYDITMDGKTLRTPGMKLYVVNAAQSGSGISVTGGFSVPDDGLVDLFVLDLRNLKTLSAAAERVLHLRTEQADNFYWRAREITIDAEPDQPVWTDGEYWGRTPISLTVVPGALPVIAPQ
jgi:YegS/Rv2252/BmrU family lipid kinase